MLLALLPGSRLGFGDVKLAAVLGLPLGWLGGTPCWRAGPGACAARRRGPRSARRSAGGPENSAALGPALLAGAWLGVLLG
ncbi:hypothetical protein NKG94_36425 [Micromonospora sp. M12]